MTTTHLRIEMLAHWCRFVIYLFVVLLLGSQGRIPHWSGKGQRLYSEIRKVRCRQYAQLVLVILLSVYHIAVLVSWVNIVCDVCQGSG